MSINLPCRFTFKDSYNSYNFSYNPCMPFSDGNYSSWVPLHTELLTWITLWLIHFLLLLRFVSMWLIVMQHSHLLIKVKKYSKIRRQENSTFITLDHLTGRGRFASCYMCMCMVPLAPSTIYFHHYYYCRLTKVYLNCNQYNHGTITSVVFNDYDIVIVHVMAVL